MSCHSSFVPGQQHPEFFFPIPHDILSSLSDGQCYWKETKWLVSPEVQCFPVYVGSEDDVESS